MSDQAAKLPEMNRQELDPAAIEKQAARLCAQLTQILLLYADIVETMRAELIKKSQAEKPEEKKQ